MTMFIIDCGHGGERQAGNSSPIGGVGPTGLREKDVTLAIGRRVAALLGPRAVLTRTDDRNLSLGERMEMARRAGARVFVSIHANEGSPGARGAETFVHSRGGAESMAMASSIQRELLRLGGGPRGTRSAELALLAPEHLPPRAAACLVEVDYLSDPEGERRLRDPAQLDQIARAIADGVRAEHYGRGDVTSGTIDWRSGSRFEWRFHYSGGSNRLSVNLNVTLHGRLPAGTQLKLWLTKVGQFLVATEPLEITPGVPLLWGRTYDCTDGDYVLELDVLDADGNVTSAGSGFTVSGSFFVTD